MTRVGFDCENNRTDNKEQDRAFLKKVIFFGLVVFFGNYTISCGSVL